jgi:hypothetical protein
MSHHFTDRYLERRQALLQQRARAMRHAATASELCRLPLAVRRIADAVALLQRRGARGFGTFDAGCRND